MWLKVPERKSRGWSALAQRLAILATVVAYSTLMIVLGVVAHHLGWTEAIVAHLTRFPSYQLRQLGAHLHASPRQITIDIKQVHYDKIVAKREEALRKNMLFASTEDFVPAKIRYDNRVLNVALRLKGDLRDHWSSSKWSLRVAVRGDDTLFGMKQFSLQHPRTRGYVAEWLYHRALRREGLPALRYEFVDVTLNGKRMGVYALEEHFEKRLIEDNQRREGPIVRFGEDINWREIFEQSEGRIGNEKQQSGSGSYLASETDGFQTQSWLDDPVRAPIYRKAIHLLEAFRRGELSTSRAFDSRLLARYFAVTDLLGAGHAANWRNARYYYNPITSRLEPIGFDAGGHGEPPLRSLLGTYSRNLAGDGKSVYYYHLYFFDTFFRDLTFFEEYLAQLERVSQPTYLEELFEDIDAELRDNLAILNREYPASTLNRAALERNRRYIQSVLHPARGIHAYFEASRERTVTLAVGNVQYLPLEVLNATLIDSPGAPVCPPDRPERLILNGRDPSAVVDYRRVSFRLPEGSIWADTRIASLRVQYRVLGTEEVRSETVFPHSYAEAGIPDDVLRMSPNHESWPFLTVDEEDGLIAIHSGVWNIDRTMILPPGYTVRSSGGTTLNLLDGANLISYSPVEFVGSAELPIHITSADSTGQGFVVFAGGRASTLEHVVFEKLANPDQDGWTLTGAVTFYESPAILSNCSFIANRSEDALNIIRSEYGLDHAHFADVPFDAFDADFTRGWIRDSSFRSCGNDAVDVSGSHAQISAVTIVGAGDKGISVGENSEVNVEDVTVEKATIALASKDHSRLDVSDALLSDCRYGLAAYQKKSEFGPGTIHARRLQFTDVGTPHLVEKRSAATLDGEALDATQESVYDMIYKSDG